MNWISGGLGLLLLGLLVAWVLSRNPRLVRIFKWSFWLLMVLLVGGFLHYTLPQTDIVRVVGTNTKRIDHGSNSWFWSGPDASTVQGTVTRDVDFVDTIRPNGRSMVYRNEDTGWGWPPYFKFNSHNIRSSAQDLVSTSDAPKWVAVQHYGWRNEFFSIFPNVVSVRQVAGPDVSIFPWAATIILVLLAFVIFLVWRMLVQFRERMIEPMVDRVGDGINDLDARADRARGRVRGWFSRK